MKNQPEQTFNFLGARWTPWNASDFWPEFITMAPTTIVFFGGYLIIKSLIIGRWQRRLGNWFEFIFIMNAVIFAQKFLMSRYFS